MILIDKILSKRIINPKTRNTLRFYLLHNFYCEIIETENYTVRLST